MQNITCHIHVIWRRECGSGTDRSGTGGSGTDRSGGISGPDRWGINFTLSLWKQTLKSFISITHDILWVISGLMNEHRLVKERALKKTWSQYLMFKSVSLRIFLLLWRWSSQWSSLDDQCNVHLEHALFKNREIFLRDYITKQQQ